MPAGHWPLFRLKKRGGAEADLRSPEKPWPGSLAPAGIIYPGVVPDNTDVPRAGNRIVLTFERHEYLTAIDHPIVHPQPQYLPARVTGVLALDYM